MKAGPSLVGEGPAILELETTLPQTTKKLKNERGQTMTELALVLPILVVLILGIAQFGLAFNNYVTLTDAARAAARKGAVSRQASSPTSDCQNAGYSAGGNLKNPGTDFKVTCSSSWTIGSDVTVTATYPYSISLLGWVVKSGTLTSTMKERVE
jgi:Flp pilus assembly protein TadG